jgi:hypothetical protein
MPQTESQTETAAPRYEPASTESQWLKLGDFKGSAKHNEHADELIVLGYRVGVTKGQAGTQSLWKTAMIDVRLDKGAGDVMMMGCAPPITTADADSQDAGEADKIDATLTVLGGVTIEFGGCRVMSANISGVSSYEDVLQIGLKYDTMKITPPDKGWNIREGKAL